MFQIIDGCVDLIQRVAIRYQLIQIQFAIAVPANKERKVTVRTAVATAGARKGAAAGEQARIQSCLSLPAASDRSAMPYRPG